MLPKQRAYKEIADPSRLIDEQFYSSSTPHISLASVAMNIPILYIKSGCPWCTEALSYFSTNNIRLETREVRSNKAFMEQMVKHSSQTKTPTFVHGKFVVADFDIGEFKAALNQAPAVKAQLGL